MARYRLDADQGQFRVQAFAEGLLSSFGHNPTLSVRRFSGEFRFDPAAPTQAVLSVRVEAGSLEVADDVSRKDRQEIETRTREEVFEVSKFPLIEFQSSAVQATELGENQFRLLVNGKLTLHGVEKNLPIELHARLGPSDARLRGDSKLKQSDFHIRRVSAVGGAIRVKDEVKLHFELVAPREDA